MSAVSLLDFISDGYDFVFVFAFNERPKTFSVISAKQRINMITIALFISDFTLFLIILYLSQSDCSCDTFALFQRRLRLCKSLRIDEVIQCTFLLGLNFILGIFLFSAPKKTFFHLFHCRSIFSSRCPMRCQTEPNESHPNLHFV